MISFDLKKSTSVHVLPLTEAYPEQDLLELEELIEHSAQLLPAYGPIGGFAFQNPLHALEYLPFEEALQVGNQLFGGQPYLPESYYRDAMASGRILAIDLRAILEEDALAWDLVNRLSSRLHLRMTMLLAPICAATAPEIEWVLAENDVLTRFQENIPTTVRRELVTDVKRWVVRDLINAGSNDGGYHEPAAGDLRQGHILYPLLQKLAPALRQDNRGPDDRTEQIWEEFTLRSLWAVCLDGVRRTVEGKPPEPILGERPRDLLLRATGVDTDRLVHDLLIRFCGAFTDQGMSHWNLPDKHLGFYRCFMELYGQRGGQPDAWLRDLVPELTRLRKARLGPMDSIRESLELLGIEPEEWAAFLPATLSVLRGWGTIIRQMEVRGDRVHHPVPRGTLIDFLAVRLILERVALRHVAREQLGFTADLSGLRKRLREVATPRPARDVVRAFTVFQLALRAGWKPSAMNELSGKDWRLLQTEIESFGDLERRRVFHAAFERRLRTQALEAIAARVKKPPRKPTRPIFQLACCIDAREESFRRHLEEICPDVETIGVAGFFGVPMYYRGLGEAFPSALCPIVMRPQHWVVEEPVFQLAGVAQSRARTRQVIGAISHKLHVASRGGAVGALVSGILGNLAIIPLVAQVLFPRWASWFAKISSGLTAPLPVTRLVLERTTPAPGPNEGEIGFSVEEMTNIGERLLRDIGLIDGFGRLVFFLGHGSSSMNNPHQGAYHCGACAGSPGGPNARAAAMMLNDPRVRAKLAARGLEIPLDTIFLGAMHNTGDDTIQFYDLDLLPRSHYKDVEQAQEILRQTCERNAQERCRRFYSAPLNISPEAAHDHVHIRTVDLAQTRTEFGNASNAYCHVGRRDRIRGLFLDRRAFLQSYDPTQDDQKGTILARILSAVIPVCAGINMEYYFSSVDSTNWGCGTKLPHNLTSLLGVMDGAASDLRLGLPRQGVEIHEPVRILFVIETTPEIMHCIMKGNSTIDRNIRNGWVQLALLDPRSPDLMVWSNGAFQPYQIDDVKLPVTDSSDAWYRGSRDHLEFVDVVYPMK